LEGRHVVSASAGGDHVVALTVEGLLWGWGCDEDGQVGQGVEGVQYGRLELLPVSIELQGE
jgi:alpha-tubulin suppressor-like RCC1 family protein